MPMEPPLYLLYCAKDTQHNTLYCVCYIEITKTSDLSLADNIQVSSFKFINTQQIRDISIVTPPCPAS